MSEKILVTGATGTLGSEVVRQLSKETSDIAIRAAIHSIENINKAQYRRVETIQIDYDKQESLSKAFDGIDKLFLLTHPSSKAAEHESNLVRGKKVRG